MDTVKWRPEGWFAPVMLERLYVDVGVKPTYQEVYEAGADAMLESLKKEALLMTPEQMELLCPDREYSYGYLMFLPVAGK